MKKENVNKCVIRSRMQHYINKTATGLITTIFILVVSILSGQSQPTISNQNHNDFKIYAGASYNLGLIGGSFNLDLTATLPSNLSGSIRYVNGGYFAISGIENISKGFQILLGKEKNIKTNNKRVISSFGISYYYDVQKSYGLSGLVYSLIYQKVPARIPPTTAIGLVYNRRYTFPKSHWFNFRLDSRNYY